MRCQKCDGEVTYKDNHKDISLLCKCEMIFIRPDKSMKTIPIEDYDKSYKKR